MGDCDCAIRFSYGKNENVGYDSVIMNTINALMDAIPEIEDRLGYHFKDSNLLVLSFIHRSYINESRDVDEHNERLEFLGDSVLGIIISEKLYRDLPHTPEGELSAKRSRLVEASACMTYVQQLDVESHVLLGKGERLNDGRGRDSILADLFEAIIGAIYLDGGLEAARAFVFNNFSSQIDAILQLPIRNWKAVLQEYCQRHFQRPPEYRVMEEVGPDHSKTFRVVVVFDDKEQGEGVGASKKEAQQASAADALMRLGEINLI